MRWEEAEVGVHGEVWPWTECPAVPEVEKSAAPLGIARDSFEFMMDGMVVMRMGPRISQVRTA